ncbi:hypothetical protein [Bacillus solimangrovi]|uniref:Uncharacterized protein n=1 Tax=Bacillus solimangrovi TaxID=1305675 RepID=A0A1E5LJF1_9BACI|nr:hypothetical protein [Bacillus solimangrovi]OEH94210.1 hypothetical protein BFG57_09160 [Bacillus solimangrovi]
MYKYFFIILILFLTACSEKEVDAPSTTVEEDAQLRQMNVSDKTISKQEAVQLVREHLNLIENDQTKIEFDHMQDANYVIHVYETITDSSNSTHSTTLGWYLVNQHTHKIENLQ